MCLHINWKADLLVISTVFLKLKDFSRSQTVTYIGNVAITWKRWSRCYYRLLVGSDMSYQTAAISMTFRDVQGDSPNAIHFKCDFSYSCPVADKISTDIVHYEVPLRQLRFLFILSRSKEIKNLPKQSNALLLLSYSSTQQKQSDSDRRQ